MLITVKILLGMDPNDHTQDQLLDTYCQIMTNKVKNYCNILAVPPQLKDIVAEMAATLYKKQTASASPSQPVASGTIKKETVGNHTIEYVTDGASSSSSTSVTSDILGDYKVQLNPFRRVRFI